MFDVLCDAWWLERKNIEDVASKLDIEAVPIIGRGVLQDAVKHTREGFKSTIGDCIAEGIVARPETELLDRSGRRIITR